MSNPIVVMFENIIDGLEKKLDAAEAEIARIKAGYIAAKESVQKIVVGLEAENKRLREALERIASAHDEHKSLIDNPRDKHDAYQVGASKALDWAQRIAKAALATPEARVNSAENDTRILRQRIVEALQAKKKPFSHDATTLDFLSTNGDEYYVGAAVGLNLRTGRAVTIKPNATDVRFVGWCKYRTTGDGNNTVTCRIDGEAKKWLNSAPEAHP